jgi:hypothetical protein
MMISVVLTAVVILNGIYWQGNVTFMYIPTVVLMAMGHLYGVIGFDKYACEIRLVIVYSVYTIGVWFDAVKHCFRDSM